MTEFIRLISAALEFMSPFWTGVVIGTLIGFLLYPRIGNSLVAVQWREKQEARKNRAKDLAKKQFLLDRGLEFDACQTISDIETGERYCPECFEMDKTLNKLKPMHKRYKPMIFCSKCGSRYC